MNNKKLTYVLSDFYRNPISSVSLELILTILLVLVLTIFAIRPTLTTMGELSKEISEKKEVENKLKQKIASLNTAQVEYLSWQEQLSMLDSALPSSDSTIRDIKTIEKLAFESNVILTNLSLSKFPDKSNYTEAAVFNQPINITVEGDYISVRNFVERLQKNRRVMVVNTISFSIRKQRGSDESLAATMSINTPYYF